MSARRIGRLLLLALVTTAAGGSLAVAAGAEGLPAGAEWRLEQPPPPAPVAGVEESLGLPVGLGAIGDVEFFSSDRGALITAGNGSTVRPGIWVYNGQAWHELTAQTPEEGICGAANGRIAWAGPDEFWTVSNGRPGQAPDSQGNLPSLEDNTLCHFTAVGPKGEPLAKFEVVKSYASLAFQSTSYQAMHAAACISPTNCWFGGSPLPAPAVGSFQLHWNGSTLAAEPYLPEGHAVEDMRAFEGQVFESLRLSETDPSIRHALEVPALHVLGGEGAGEPVPELAEELYGPNEDLFALDYLRLSANENALWAAAGSEPQPPEPTGSIPAGVTVLRYSRVQYSSASKQYEEEVTPAWKQVLGPRTTPTGSKRFPEEVVNSIAAEPQTNDLWIALESQEEAQAEASGHPSPIAHATLALLSADGEILDELQLPAAKGAAAHVVCPAVHDCWVATTAGWLFHLATAEEREQAQTNGDSAFSGTYVITYRPEDEGVPPQTPTTLPVDDSGLTESRSGLEGVRVEPVAEEQFARVTLPLLSHERTRLRHGTELEFSFHLAVKARVRLIAKRRKSVVASTPTRTLQAGNRSLLLQLNVKRWPTKLNLQTHALGPLPTASTRENNSSTNTVTYGLVFPHARAPIGASVLGFGPLP
jgi:hypothetical protein